MAELREYDVTIVMRLTENGEAQTRPFSLRVPCVDEYGAHTAAVQLGLAVNEGSGSRWKLTDDVSVRLADAPGVSE